MLSIASMHSPSGVYYRIPCKIMNFDTTIHMLYGGFKTKVIRVQRVTEDFGQV